MKETFEGFGFVLDGATSIVVVAETASVLPCMNVVLYHVNKIEQISLFDIVYKR